MKHNFETNKGLSHKRKKKLARSLAGPGEAPFTSKGWAERKARIAERAKRQTLRQQLQAAND